MPPRRPPARPRRSCPAPWLGLLGLLLGLLLGCQAVTRLPAAPEGARRVPLQIVATPPDVEVFLDDEYQGELARWNDSIIPVAVGEHRLELRRAGYFPLRRLIQVGPAGSRLTVTLLAEPATLAPGAGPGDPF